MSRRRSHSTRFVLVTSRLDPNLDVERAIAEGRVRVDGKPIFNARALIRADAHVVVDEPRELRGTLKLRAAFALFPDAKVHGTALDLGACTGGFTKALLERGVKRVYAVDAGAGQLLGSLRLDPRVVNLEKTNLGSLAIDEEIDFVVADLSYLSLSQAFTELDRVRFARDAQAIVLVKPQFELGLANAPLAGDEAKLDEAIAKASAGLVRAGFCVVGSAHSPLTGAGGAIEGFVHAVAMLDPPPP